MKPVVPKDRLFGNMTLCRHVPDRFLSKNISHMLKGSIFVCVCCT